MWRAALSAHILRIPLARRHAYRFGWHARRHCRVCRGARQLHDGQTDGVRRRGGMKSWTPGPTQGSSSSGHFTAVTGNGSHVRDPATVSDQEVVTARSLPVSSTSTSTSEFRLE